MRRFLVVVAVLVAAAAVPLGAGCASATGEGPIASAHLERVPGLIVPLPPSAPPAPTAELLGPYPPPDSDDGKADLAIVLWLQRTRGAADIERARSEVTLGLDTFAAALGPDFVAAARPRTRALLEQVEQRTRPAVADAKRRFQRARPYDSDARVGPAIDRERSFSYPSGHATRGVVLARVLAELAPDRRQPLLAIGLRIGYDRVVAGVHYPSDVTAGQQLGAAIADTLLADPQLRHEIDGVRAAEWSAGPGAGGPVSRARSFPERRR